MNKLFRVLFVGAYIPYVILLSYYVTRLYVAYMLVLLLHLSSSYALLMHRPFLEKGVLAWARAKRVCELLLLASYSVRAHTKSQLLTLFVVASLTVAVTRIPKRYQYKCEHPAVYVTAAMVFLTQTDVLGKVAIIIQSALVLYEKQARDVSSASFEFAIERRLRQYHTLKLLQIYMIFLMEYTLTRMNMSALAIVLLCAGVFNAYACFTLPSCAEVKVGEYYPKVHELPERYPLPLDIRNAIESCEVARKVFKSHEI